MEIHKIRPDMPSDPALIIAMLMQHRKRIKHIAAIVVWDDDSYQLCHDAMKKSEMAYSLVLFQKTVMEDID